MHHTAQIAATIRRAGAADSAALAQLRWLWRTSERGEVGLTPAAFEAAFTDWWSARQSSHVAYIAEHGGDPVGMAWLAVFDRIPQPRDLGRQAGNVQSVFVLEELRNQGIGSALVEAVIAEARTRGVGYKTHALVVCLWASPEKIWERVKNQTHRPLLHDPDPQKKIRELLAAREQFYKQADVLVNTDIRSPREVAQHVVHQFRLEASGR